MNKETLLNAISNKTGWEIPSYVFVFPSEKPVEEIDNSMKGNHRIIISLHGDVEYFSPTVIFQGWDKNGFACYIYAYGGVVMDSRYVFDFDKVRFSRADAHTSTNCKRFVATIAFLNEKGITGKVDVLCRGFFNNKLMIKEHRVFEMSNNFICNFEYFDSVRGFVKF